MSTRPWETLATRHEPFLACHPIGRPLLGAWIGGYYPAEQFPRGHGAWDVGTQLDPQSVSFESFREDYERLYRLHEEADDDFFYVGSPYWGIPWLEAILGCAIEVRSTSCTAASCLAEPGSGRREAKALSCNPWWECLVRFTDELVGFADGRFPVCPPLLRGPGDAVAALCGSQQFILGAVEDEPWFRPLLEHCAGVRLEVIERLQQRIPDWHGTHAAGGYPSKVWSSRTVCYYQDDAAALLNPRLFSDLLLPLARRSAPAAEIHFIHLHSSCLYMLETLLEDDTFAVIEVNLDRAGSGPPLAKYLPALKRIQQAGRPLLLWGEISPSDWTLLQAELTPTGLSIQPMVRQPDQVRDYRGDWREP